MQTEHFKQRVDQVRDKHQKLITRSNIKEECSNGIFHRYQFPVVTANHIPLTWRYDFNPETNPYFMERIQSNATFNSAAIFRQNKYQLVVRVEGADRKSYFAVAESDNGIDNFVFRAQPITMPETDDPDVNVYDMRLTEHEDGYIYGLFCTERKDQSKPHDQSAAVANCGIARTKDLVNWERLPDLKTTLGQQRNVVLHSEFVDGQYAFYLRSQRDFIGSENTSGIGWGLCKHIDAASIDEEVIIDKRYYHTINEQKNGMGPAPIKTESGWLHLAHGVRNTAAGLRYVLYMFMTDLNEPWKIIHKPGGHFIAPEDGERVGDVSNVAFSNGWAVNEKNEVFIYYGGSDTRLYVATSTVEQLVDYVKNTPEDRGRSATSVDTINRLVDTNNTYFEQNKHLQEESESNAGKITS